MHYEKHPKSVAKKNEGRESQIFSTTKKHKICLWIDFNKKHVQGVVADCKGW
jgi:hypothetical protein